MIVSVVLNGLSCSPKPGRRVLGKWKQSNFDQSRTLEFFSEGTIIGTTGDDAKPSVGKYVFLDERRVKIDMGSGPMMMVVEFQDGGSYMLLLDSEHSPIGTRYRRVK